MSGASHRLRRPPQSAVCNLPYSYHPTPLYSIVLFPGNAHIPGTGAYLLLAHVPRQRTASIFPLLTTKTAPTQRVIDLLYARRRSRMQWRTRFLFLSPREVLGNRPSLVMDLLLDRMRVLTLLSSLQIVRSHSVLNSAGAGQMR